MNNWVAPYLSDGLGNRLFQFSCAKQFSEENKKPLVFFLPRCAPTNHGRFDTIFKLFPEVPIIETDVSWNEIEEPLDKHFTYIPIKPTIGLPIVIRGYRQSYKYFDKIKVEPKFVDKYNKAEVG